MFYGPEKRNIAPAVCDVGRRRGCHLLISGAEFHRIDRERAGGQCDPKAQLLSLINLLGEIRGSRTWRNRLTLSSETFQCAQ